MKDKKKKKVKYVDDGHTIYSMENLVPKGEYNTKGKNVGLSWSEKWAAIKAAMMVYGPILLLVLLGFTMAMLLIYFWLR